jgi:two-component system sensor histidine kinase RpfC
METRQRCSSVLPERPTDMQLRRALTIACRLAAPAASGEVAPPPLAPPGRARRVLLADDNRINQRVFSRILEGGGHSVLLAETGDQVLDLLEERAGQIDIVLMDFNMPDTDGLEATKLYRMMAGGGRRLPIIGLTADATALTDNRWRDAGMDECLIKPLEPAALLAAVERFARDEPGQPAPPLPRPTLVPADLPPSLDERAIENLRKLGGTEFVTELMEDYLVDAEAMLDRLTRSAAQGHLAEFRTDSHALQSSSANIGAVALGCVCAPFRDLRGEELRAGAPEFTRRAKAELRRTQEAMRAYTARAADPG